MGKTFKVVLDTNFLIDLFRFKTGFDEVEDALGGHVELFMVSQSEAELRRLSDVSAKVGAGFVDSGKIGVVKAGRATEKSADEAIVELVGKWSPDVVVATNDGKLRKRIKASGVRTIYLRARKRLEVS
jgi:rRNA-processing protein FCF1